MLAWLRSQSHLISPSVACIRLSISYQNSDRYFQRLTRPNLWERGRKICYACNISLSVTVACTAKKKWLINCLLYALEACPVNKTQLRSLEFTLNRVLMKVFRTTSMDVIAECRYWFGLLEMETLIAKRKQRFTAKYVQSDVLCQLFAHVESV